MMKYAHCSWIGAAAPPKFRSAASAARDPGSGSGADRRAGGISLSPILPLGPDGPDEPPGGQGRSAGLDDPYRASPGWMVRGACRGIDPELFLPLSVTGRSTPQIDAAKTICGQCVVSEAGLSYALRVMPDGIWGGTTREERAAVRHQLVRPWVPAEG